MGENTKIPWSHHSFNPWVGCSGKVSPACDNCYAAAQSKRYGQIFTSLRMTSAQNWNKPLKWQKQATRENRHFRVFCGSMCDVFDIKADPDWRNSLYHLIDETPYLDWLLLTKRPQHIQRLKWPKNVMLGITAENQKQLSIRRHQFTGIHCRGIFVSIEPMLEQISPEDLNFASWVIVGCEKIGVSKPGRPMNEEWLREIVENRKGATFVKQMAIDGKVTDDPAKFPAWARRREFPKD